MANRVLLRGCHREEHWNAAFQCVKEFIDTGQTTPACYELDGLDGDTLYMQVFRRRKTIHVRPVSYEFWKNFSGESR